MFAAKDPKTKILKDPAVSNRLINEIDEAYIDEVTKKLSEKEIDYLLLLYVSPMYQKYINLEKEFWNQKAPNIEFQKSSLAEMETVLAERYTYGTVYSPWRFVLIAETLCDYEVFRANYQSAVLFLLKKPGTDVMHFYINVPEPPADQLDY